MSLARSCAPAVVCAVMLVAACSSKASTDSSTTGTAATPTVEKAAAPAAAPPSVAVSGKVTTVTGAGDQVSAPIRFDAGTYLFNWTGTGAFVGITLTDTSDSTVNVFALGGANAQDIFSVDNEQVKAGDIKLQVSSDGGWTVKIEKVDPSSPAPLPQVLTGEELKSAISQPFKLAAGAVNVTYTFKSTPKGTGTLQVCDVNTGKRVGGLMYAGNESGTVDLKAPAAGVYMVRASFPLGSGGGEVRVSQ